MHKYVFLNKTPTAHICPLRNKATKAVNGDSTFEKAHFVPKGPILVRQRYRLVSKKYK